MAGLFYDGGDYINYPAPVSSMIAVELGYDDANGTYQVPVEAGTLVENVWGVTITAFNGTGASLNISDSDSASTYYLTNANLALTVAATTTTPAIKNASVTGAANGYGNGKYYAAAGNINFVFVASTSGTPTTGRFLGFVKMFNVLNSGLTAT